MQGLPPTLGMEKQKSKVIIFTVFAKMARILHRELPNSLMIIGATPTEERQKIVEQFNTDPTKQILIGTKAISYGLNLTACDIIIHYDLCWSVGEYEQRAARSHRQGQKNTVFEYALIANHSVDGYVKKKLNSKQLISDKLMPLSELKEMLNEI